MSLVGVEVWPSLAIDDNYYFGVARAYPDHIAAAGGVSYSVEGCEFRREGLFQPIVITDLLTGERLGELLGIDGSSPRVTVEHDRRGVGPWVVLTGPDRAAVRVLVDDVHRELDGTEGAPSGDRNGEFEAVVYSIVNGRLDATLATTIAGRRPFEINAVWPTAEGMAVSMTLRRVDHGIRRSEHVVFVGSPSPPSAPPG